MMSNSPFIVILINPFSAEVEISQDKQVNTIAADALAPHVARSSAAMVSTMLDVQFPDE